MDLSSTSNVLNHSSSPKTFSVSHSWELGHSWECLQCHAQTRRIDATLPSVSKEFHSLSFSSLQFCCLQSLLIFFRWIFWFGFTLRSLEEISESRWMITESFPVSNITSRLLFVFFFFARNTMELKFKTRIWWYCMCMSLNSHFFFYKFL